MGSPTRAKTDNHPAAKEAKLELRRNVLAEVSPARVFDGFCGTGEMYRGVWHDAAAYVGCDERSWARTHPPRFVADNRRIMRAIDLQAFNVFDFDAYGSPWEQVTILAARRIWKEGEKGALVLTDGSKIRMQYGQLPKAMRLLIGSDGPIAGLAIPELMSLALAEWVKRSRVRVLKMWQAEGQPPACVVHKALVFEGQKSEG